ncbi:acetyl esterase/lipase [Catenulispora sp. MAP12-49]|uniref:alpha/beta hydrolase n=1 Tax=Catenulispora sp. MAP12-49 TaxID=3156302 RepID=UPI003510E567
MAPVTLLTFEPADTTPPRAGVILFHGGGLLHGSPHDLAPHCRRLAEHGILAVSAGYRLLGRGAANIDDCLADVRHAIEHFGQTAAAHGLGPDRLAAGGSSAGAHLALLSVLTGAAPGAAAVVALNPAGLDLGAMEPEDQRRLEERVGITPGRLTDYSALGLVRPDAPPTLIQHGTDDEIQPIDGVRRFRDAMASAGTECALVEYAGAKHAFHYPDGDHFDEVMDAAARFLLDRLDRPDRPDRLDRPTGSA